MAKTTCQSCKGAGWWCTAWGQAKCECSAPEDCKACSGMGFIGNDDVLQSEEGEVTFSAEEMVFIKAIFAGECHVSRLTEGGDYMRCFVQNWGDDDLDRFMQKISGESE